MEDKIKGAILTKMFYEDEFREVHDKQAEAFNNLSDKLLEAGIDLKYRNDLVTATDELARYEIRYCLQKMLSIL